MAQCILGCCRGATWTEPRRTVDITDKLIEVALTSNDCIGHTANSNNYPVDRCLHRSAHIHGTRYCRCWLWCHISTAYERHPIAIARGCLRRLLGLLGD